MVSKTKPQQITYVVEHALAILATLIFLCMLLKTVNLPWGLSAHNKKKKNFHTQTHTWDKEGWLV
jgi:hypothetical protein